MEKLKKSKTQVILFSTVFLALTYVPLFLQPQIVEAFVNEDWIFETLTPIYFLITSILLTIIFFKLQPSVGSKWLFRLKKFALLGFALLFFVAAGEEISWGQRIFHIETPESLKQSNVQQEITIHNLDFFQGENATLDFSQLQTLFSLTFAFLIPVGAIILLRLFKFDLNTLLPVMPISIGWLVVINYLLQKIIRNVVEVVPQIYLHPTMPFTEGLYEVREHGNAYAMMLSVLFYMAFTLYPKSEN